MHQLLFNKNSIAIHSAPGDYEAVDGVVRFEPLQQRAFVQINITDDQALERTEFFFVRLSNVIFVSQNEVVVQIIDNDGKHRTM